MARLKSEAWKAGEEDMRAKVMVVSNNPSALLADGDRFIDGDLLQVMRTARDLVHQGHLLISHPLAGSVKPNETPFKSIVLSRASKGRVDFDSLSVMEGSMRTAVRMLQERSLPTYSDHILQDFQLIDRQLLDNALASLPGYL